MDQSELAACQAVPSACREVGYAPAEPRSDPDCRKSDESDHRHRRSPDQWLHFIGSGHNRGLCDVPCGYGDTGLQVSGLNFAATGCWQVSGTVGDKALTFVVNVAAS